MNVPIELIVWLAGGISLFLSVICHLQLRIFGAVSAMDKRDAVREERYASLKRHTERNEEELEELRTQIFNRRTT